MKKFSFLLLLPLFLFSGCQKAPRGEVKFPEVTEGGAKSVVQKKVLIVVAPKDFQDTEYGEPRRILEEEGFYVVVAAKGVKEATGVYGKKVAVDVDLADVKVADCEDYEAVVFVGGPGASVYFDDAAALRLAKEFFDGGKVVSAICIAPSILANAGILQGKRATSYPSEKGNLEANGAVFTGEAVTVDGKIVTANGPSAAGEFGQEVVRLLK